jgi:hypothetical protein
LGKLRDIQCCHGQGRGRGLTNVKENHQHAEMRASAGFINGVNLGQPDLEVVQLFLPVNSRDENLVLINLFTLYTSIFRTAVQALNCSSSDTIHRTPPDDAVEGMIRIVITLTKDRCSAALVIVWDLVRDFGLRTHQWKKLRDRHYDEDNYPELSIRHRIRAQLAGANPFGRLLPGPMEINMHRGAQLAHIQQRWLPSIVCSFGKYLGMAVELLNVAGIKRCAGKRTGDNRDIRTTQ